MDNVEDKIDELTYKVDKLTSLVIGLIVMIKNNEDRAFSMNVIANLMGDEVTGIICGK